MKVKIFFIILVLVTILSTFVGANDEDVQDTSTEISTLVNSKTQASVETDSKTVTQTPEEATTYAEEYETEPPKGLIGQFLMDGPDVRQLPRNSTPEEVYTYLSELLSNEMKKEIEKVTPDLHEFFFLLQEIVSQKCFVALMRLAQRAQKGVPRALELLDSSAKIIANGLTAGTYTDLGNFDQCIRKDDSVLTENDRPLNGRYCLVKIRPPLHKARPHLKYSDRIFNFKDTELENKTLDKFLSSSHSLYSNPFTIGLCFVSECQPNDIKSLLNNSLHKYHFGVEIGKDCYTEEVVKISFKYVLGKLDFPSGLSIVLIGSLCGVVGLATIFEFFYNLFNDKNAKESEKHFFMSFSLISNVKNLYSLKTNSEENKDLNSLNGIKVMAILWIVVSNVYFLGFQPQLKAFIKYPNSEMSRRGSCLPFQLILNSWHASEIFFLIGGLLTSYTITTHLNRNNGNINLIKYFVKRLVRLMPPIVFTILLVFLMPLYPNGGPVYKSSTGALRDNCAQNWWKSLLFINNWLEPNRTCLPHLWFVSAYLQLTIIAMLVLIITYKRPKLFDGIVIIMIITGIIFPMYVTYERKLSAKSPLMDRPLLEEIPEDLKLKHFLTFSHLSVFFIGLSIGVKLCSKQSKDSLNIFFRLFLWGFLPVISLLSVFITFLWNDLKSEPSLQLSIVFNGFSRILFISGIAWIINECVNKRAGLVEKVFSNKQLLPLSRLSYQIYLLNLLVVWFYFFTKRDLIVYRDIELLFISCGVLVATVVLSIFGYLVFEAPFVRLSKRVFNTNNEVLKRELMSQMNDKHLDIQLVSIEINGNKIVSEKQDKSDQDVNVRL